MRSGWDGSWVLPVLLAAFGGLCVAAMPRAPVPAAAGASAPLDSERLEVRLSEVLVPDGTGDGAALLVDTEGRWTLPLFLSRVQAERLEQGGSGPEDAPARLLETALTQLGRHCTAVELDEEAGAPAATIVLNDGRRLEVVGGQLEAALGLAVRSDAPVRASRRLLELRGIEKRAAGASGPSLPTGLRPSRSL